MTTALRDAIDYTTLGWIKPELDETLRQARIEIEAFAEDPSDTTRMAECAHLLHQVQGTLRMVELYAPARVSEEMELLARGLQRGQVEARDDACATLMRGVVLLPDYLERLQGGHKDIPVVLLPLLNELRGLRGEEELDEAVMFSPELQRPLPEVLGEGLDRTGADEVGPLLSQLDDAVAAWPAQMANLAGACAGLLNHAGRDEAVRRMLFAGTAMAEALRDAAVQPDETLRAAFAGIAAEARRLAGRGATPGQHADAVLEPTRKLLYTAARSGGDHAALRRLRDTFDLDLEASAAELAHAQSSLAGHNRALLDTVSGAIKEDLLRVKDALDLHLRGGRANVSELQPQLDAMATIADTLGMLGLEGARKLVQQQRETLQSIMAGERRDDEGALLDIAAALLYVDASLDEQVARLGAADAGDDMLANESRKVTEVLAREAIANFADARQAFVAFVETGWNHGELVEVPRLLVEVAGALQMLDLPQPAQYLDGVRAYTERELLGHKRVPSGRQLDTLADALASLEYYLEALREHRGQRNDILDIARNSLEALGYWPVPAAPEPAPAPAAVEPPTAAPATDERAAPAAPGAAEAPPAIGQPSSDIQVPAPASPELPVAPDAPVEAAAPPPAVEAPPAAAPPAPAVPPPVAAPPTPPAQPAAPVGTGAAGGFEATGDEIDDEIREIFLEEFEEEIGNLNSMLPEWQAAPDDLEKLRPIRRVFHTLKGSGRLVGARTLGEFAWKVENMLNRVLDASRPASPAVLALVAQAYEALPQLLGALRGDGGLVADLEGLEATADRVAAGEEAFHQPAGGAPAEPAQPGAAGEPVATPEPPAAAPVAEEGVPASVDAVLLEILDAEVGGHLGTVEKWLAAARAGETRVDDALMRAIHTMNGAFAMTEVPAITEAITPAEAYVKRLLAAGERASGEGVAALDDLAAAVRETVAALKTESPRVLMRHALAERLCALRDSLPEVPHHDPSVEFDLHEEAAPQVPQAPVAPESPLLDEAPEEDALARELASIDFGDFTGFQIDTGEAPAVPTPEPPSAQESLEAGLLEQERIAAERAEAERAEAERAEAERAEAERAEAERAEAERAEAERAEAERLEAERLEAERAEAARLEAERLEAERAEAERAEAERAAAAAQAAAEAPAEAKAPAEASLPSAAEDPDAPLDLTDLDPDLVDIFVEESVDLLDHSDGLLARLRESPAEGDCLVGLQRDLHTLKGGARMAGIMAVGELGHAMESLLEAVVDQRVELGRDGVPLLERGLDRLHAMVTRVGSRKAIALPERLIAEFDARARGKAFEAGADDQAPPRATPVPAPRVELKPLSAPIGDQLPGDDDDIAVRAPQEQVRIRADLLDRLVNYAGEVAIYRARLEQQLGAFRTAMGEMEQTNARLRDQLRRLDSETEAQIIARYQREHDTGDQTFDPLELDRFSTLQQLSRALAESAADLSSLQQSMDDLTRQYETLLLQQSRVSSELQEGLMRTRMVPFDALVPRLRRVLRQAASDTGKKVQLKLDGAQGELDRNVLERMTAPLEHMLRNAVAHGLESPAERKKAKKDEEGTVRIAVRREGSEVVLEVSDDGAGLNRGAIRKRAEQRGLVQPGAVLTDSALDQLIFEPGFSTVDEVSRLAGRGVGMDVVASEVRQLGGSLDIRTKKGEGTTFLLHLPQTLAVTQAVFVRIGDTSFAVPIASVRGVGRISREDMAQEGATYRYGGEDYALHDLGLLLGHGAAKAEGQLQMPLLLIRSGDLRAAVCIDQVLGNREIVVKPVGPQVASLPGIFGATIMGDGSVVVILDIAPLVRRQAVAPREEEPVQAVEARRVPLVMVVDDSVTMRKVTGRVLERNNFEVATAKDGVDALERMVDRVPDLMLLDIEMPRMDGYELATAMKADPRLRDVPIIMITSRTGEKHRQRAMEIGVNRYLGKPYQEPELLRNVFELLAQEGKAPGRGPRDV